MSRINGAFDPSTSRTSAPIALIWINLGPYHLARARALAKRVGLAVIELCSFEEKYGWMINRDAEAFEIFTLVDGIWEEQNLSRVAVQCWRTLNRIRPSAVIIPGYSNPVALMCAIWARIARIPTILMSESTVGDRPRLRWKEALKGWLIHKLYHAATVGGKPQMRYLEQLGFDREKIAFHHNVVDNEFFAAGVQRIRANHTSADLGLPDSFFLFVGRLAPEKNLAALLEAFLDYRQKGGAWHLIIVGDGPLRGSLIDIAERSGISDRVRFVGAMSAGELLPYYAFSRCFILPSTSEPWGLVVNEAMASGLPVLVSRSCGCVEDLVREGWNGFSFDPYDPHALSCFLLKSEGMGGTLAFLGEHSKQTIANFTPDRWAEGVVGLLADAS